MFRIGRALIGQATRRSAGSRLNAVHRMMSSARTYEGCGLPVESRIGLVSSLDRSDGPRVDPSSLNSLHTPSFEIVADDMKNVYNEVIAILLRNITSQEAFDIVNSYYEDHGNNVSVNTYLFILVAKALSFHTRGDGKLTQEQIKTLAIMDLLLCVSILHDDIWDETTTRRGLKTAHVRWGQLKVTFAGTLVIAACAFELSTLNEQATLNLHKMNELIVRGQYMAVNDDFLEGDVLENVQKWNDYKSGAVYSNTFSALAHSGKCSALIQETAFRLGFHLGLLIAYVDDIRDIKIDLETATVSTPVALALQEHPQLLGVAVKRRFRGPGDLQRAFEVVMGSGAVNETRRFATASLSRAGKYLQMLADSPWKKRVHEFMEYTYTTGWTGFKEDEFLDVMGKRGY